MVTERKERHVYRLCPCDPWDMEGLQSWLEDLAAEGLFLTEDGVFCGVFTFERKHPARTAYRLDAAQKQKPRFFSNGNGLTEEEIEFYRAMGWEYLAQYGDFRIYRACRQDAPELNTESQTHALAIGWLKKSQRSAFVSGILMALFWLLHTSSALLYACLSGVNVGIIFILCAYSFLLYVTVKPLFRVIKLRKCEKRLRDGDSLNHYRPWRKKAWMAYCVKILPLVLCCGIVFSFLSAFSRASAELPLEIYAGKTPFATVADAFPAGSNVKELDWLDYGTARKWENALAKNMEWNENCDVTTPDGKKFHCILLLEYHETAGEWLARGLEHDYYVRDVTRYNGKRFEDIAAPELGIDSVRVYNSYGSHYILMRHGNRVIHAVVRLDEDGNGNQWLLWAEAMAEMLRK